MGDGRRVRQGGVAAAQLGRDVGVQGAEALDVDLVEHQVGRRVEDRAAARERDGVGDGQAVEVEGAARERDGGGAEGARVGDADDAARLDPERTREIGIRMAIGARQKDVLSQFLLESLVISITGGAIGLLVGMGGAHLVGRIWQADIGISVDAVVLAFMISAGTGVFFGFYPALKASRLDPIEALRYH